MSGEPLHFRENLYINNLVILVVFTWQGVLFKHQHQSSQNMGSDHYSDLLTIRIMNTPKIIPKFSYNLSNSQLNEFGSVMADDVLFHRISNVGEFYRVLGYTDDLRMGSQILPDEYIWDRFTRDNASKSAQCLQTHIAVYLNNHSEKFRAEYGSEYANMIGKCASDRIDDSDFCVDCPMHPRVRIV